MRTYIAKDLLTERYGQQGSDSREKFRESAYSYYFGEIIRNRRKELKMSQEKLAEVVGKKDHIFHELKMVKMLEYRIYY